MDVQPPDSGAPFQPDPPMPPPPSGKPGAAQAGYGLGAGLRGRGLGGGQPPQQRRRIQTRTLPAFLVLAGGLAVVIGVFLPWVQASGLGTTVTVNGIKYGTYGTLIMGGFAAANGASMLRPDLVRMGLGTPVIGGVVIGALMAARWSILTQDVANYNALPGVTANMGVGVWLVIGGAACVVVGGLMSGRPGRL
jgi:hypothetical protein